MSKTLTTLVLLALLALPGAALATNVTLIYSGTGLMDENMAYLQPGDLVYILSVGPDGQIDPPRPDTGGAGGDDVLLGTTTISDGVGSFAASISNVPVGTVVYIRFFNSAIMGQVTYYGLTGLWTVSDPFGIGVDVWDVTPAGSYFWTEYPWIVVPEPGTWLLLLPALAAGVWLEVRRKRRKRDPVGTT